MVPAIFPTCDLPWFELGLGELGEVADGVDDVSMVEGTIGVASGESPALCAAVISQVLDASTSRYAQWGTRVSPGIEFGYVEGEDTLVQLADQPDHSIQDDP